MTSGISSISEFGGIVECIIYVTDGVRYYHKTISVPSEQATEENIEIWKVQAMGELSHNFEK